MTPFKTTSKSLRRGQVYMLVGYAEALVIKSVKSRKTTDGGNFTDIQYFSVATGMTAATSDLSFIQMIKGMSRVGNVESGLLCF